MLVHLCVYKSLHTLPVTLGSGKSLVLVSGDESITLIKQVIGLKKTVTCFTYTSNEMHIRIYQITL